MAIHLNPSEIGILNGQEKFELPAFATPKMYLYLLVLIGPMKNNIKLITQKAQEAEEKNTLAKSMRLWYSM